MRLHQILFYLLILFLPVQLGRHFWPSWTYIYGLRIDYLSPTLYLTDLLILGVLASWFFSGLKVEKIKFFGNKKPLVILGFIFGFLVVNCFFAQNQGAAFFKLIKIIELILLGFYLAKNHPTFPIFYPLLATGIIISGLVALAQFLKASSLGGIFWWLGERTFNISTPGIARGVFRENVFLRPYSFFSHPNSLAGYLLVASILIRPFFYKKNKYFSFLFYSFIALILVLTYSWSSWGVSGLIGFLAFFALWFKNRHWQPRFPKRLLLIGFSFFLLSFFLLTFFYHLLALKKDSLDKRVILNRVAINLISRSPALGVGLNNFIPAMSREDNLVGQSYWLQPVHNLYLLIFSETGIIGLGLFLIFIAKSYQRLFLSIGSKGRLAESDLAGFSFCLGGCLTAILLLGLFDHYWLTLPQNQILMTLVLGLIWQRNLNLNR